MLERKIFRNLMSIDQVRSILRSKIQISLSEQDVKLDDAFGKVLAKDVISSIDVPSFDRATMDGFAVKASDTYGANEVQSKTLKLVGTIEPGAVPNFRINNAEACEIATGATLPGGANAVVMLEYTKSSDETVEIFKSVTPGENVMAAGSDIMSGELLLRRGQMITSREIGVLAALGRRTVKVLLSPKVSVISTGNELVEPGSELTKAKIYDINSHAIAVAVKELGGLPIMMGIVTDNEDSISNVISSALRESDVVLTSGSTSAGRRDLIPKIISSLEGAEVIANGLAVKPGKPALVALVSGKPLFALPGNPTSALMVFHSIVAPVLRVLAGTNVEDTLPSIDASVAFKTFSISGKQELLPVHIVTDGFGRNLAYPVGSGSGAITSFALADGFIRISSERDILEEGERVQVHLFSRGIKLPELVIIGSHCIGLDILLRVISDNNRWISAKIINVGSLAGLHALKKGEADIAGIHLLDEKSSDYNLPFIKKLDLIGKVFLVRGYAREQGFITAKGNPKGIYHFEDLTKPEVNFINRNTGSGTRILIDMNLSAIASNRGVTFEQLTNDIKGYDLETKSHSAIASAVSNGRADVGFGIKTVAEHYDLDFVPHSLERYDFAVHKSRIHKDSVQLFLDTLKSQQFKSTLEKEAPGLLADDETGSLIKQ